MKSINESESKILKNIHELRKIEFEEREKHLKNSSQQKLKYNPKCRLSLRITYVMTWTGICGGSKIILEHANKLTKMGHEVCLISHYSRPDWFQLEKKIKFIQVPWEQILCESIPECDIIVATYWREIYECVEQKKAPVVYFEQGDFHLFDLEKLDDRTYQHIKKQLKTIRFVYTVSSFAQSKLKEIYNTDSIIIPNAVNNKIFYYEPHKIMKTKVITLIGAEQSEFKRIGNILDALEIIKNKGYQINIKWITPIEPIRKVEAIVNPPQREIGEVLRKTDVYICASMYESFCLPVLEAMSCGAAVITTNNGGNMDFVKNNENAILIKKDDVEDIVEKLEMLLNNESLRNTISKNAVETARQYSWDKTMEQIIQYYKSVADYEVE